MSEIPVPKLFRSSHPLGHPPQTTDSSFNKAPNSFPGNDPIADGETAIIPSFSSYPSHSSIADIETLLIPSLKKKQRARKSKLGKALLIVSVALVLFPSLLIVFELADVFTLYKQMQDGMAHLQAAADVFHGGPSGDIAKYFATDKLRQALSEIDTAHADFASLSDRLEHDSAIGLLSTLLPAQIHTVRALDHIATDGTAAAQQLVKTMINIAPSVAFAIQHNPFDSQQIPSETSIISPNPYITPAAFQEIDQTLVAIEPLVHDMNINAQGLSLNTLPISSKQQQLLATVLPLLPVLDGVLLQEHEWKDALAWFLGIDSQRIFLIEPMDRAELRATGGFTGQFGDLVLNGAHPGPLRLSNIGKYEEDHRAEGSSLDKTVYPKVVGQSAPAPYAHWWPIANFGLRDSNLSADFPTSAKIAMNRYAYEFGKNVDGVIMFTPTLIQYILHVTGPITIPTYNEIITEQNLIDRLHYYQLDNAGISQEESIEHVNDPQLARKLFTQKVTAALLSMATHLPLQKLLPIATAMLHSMKSKDLQIYVTNPQLESLIGKYGSTGSLDRSTSHDGLFIVQSNLSADKASQYVTTTIQDTITLDAKGGATHNLQMTLDYQKNGDVYGFDTYRDYVRVYAPLNSRLLAGNGFEQYAKPYCGDALSGFRLCSPDVYGDGALVCLPPVEIGYATSYLNDPYKLKDHPLNVLGPPQNQQSDEAGRAMFGGWVVIPKNCTLKVKLSWYVPPMGQHPYSLLLQAQASVYAQLDLTIQPAPRTCVTKQGAAAYFSKVLDGEDITFTLKQQGSECSLVSQ